MITSAKVAAIDRVGNKFEKTVTIREGTGFHEGMKIICFGWPVEYVADDLVKYYPFQKDMCIDIAGQNHKGSKVTISAEQMDKILEGFGLVNKQN